MIAGLQPYPRTKASACDWFGDVPEHWPMVRLRRTVSGCINGTWGSDPTGGDDDIACVRVADFDRGRRYVRDRVPTIRAVPRDGRRRRLLLRGDLLIEKSGGGEQQPVGMVVGFDSNIPAVCSNFVARMPVATGNDGRFLTYLHEHLYARGVNVRSIKQTTGIQNLDSDAYLRERVAVPPLEEQQAIARYLDYATGRIARYVKAKRDLVRLLEEQMTVVVNDAVTRGLARGDALTASGIEGVPDIPERWTVRRGKFVFTSVDVRSETGAEELLTVSARHGVVPRSERAVTMFMAESYVGHKLCWPEDLVINSLWAWAGGLGFATHHGIVSTAYGVYRLRAPYKRHWQFLDYLLRSPAYRWQLNVRSKGIWKSRLQLTDRAFLDMPIVLPPPDEAAAIVEHIEAATRDSIRTIGYARREIALIGEYRASLIGDLVTGKFDVRAAAADLSDFDGVPESLEDDEHLPDLDEGAEVTEVLEVER
jgi:type I restriction enzyme S subunit